MSEEYAVKRGEFSWALEQLKRGKKVTRACDGDNWFIALQARSPLSKMTQEYIYMNCDGDMMPWHPTDADLLDDDWRLVEEDENGNGY